MSEQIVEEYLLEGVDEIPEETTKDEEKEQLLSKLEEQEARLTALQNERSTSQAIAEGLNDLGKKLQPQVVRTDEQLDNWEETVSETIVDNPTEAVKTILKNTTDRKLETLVTQVRNNTLSQSKNSAKSGKYGWVFEGHSEEVDAVVQSMLPGSDGLIPENVYETAAQFIAGGCIDERIDARIQEASNKKTSDGYTETRNNPVSKTKKIIVPQAVVKRAEQLAMEPVDLYRVLKKRGEI